MMKYSYFSLFALLFTFIYSHSYAETPDFSDGVLHIPELTVDKNTVYHNVELNIDLEKQQISIQRAEEEHLLHLPVLLNAGQETEPTSSMGSGMAQLKVNPNTGAIYGHVHLMGLTDVTAAHIHMGKAGENGAAIITLHGNDNLMFLPHDAQLDTAQLTQLNEGGLYINVHTQAHPAGELRGQIHVNTPLTLTAHLTPEQEVPPATTLNGSAHAVMTLHRKTGMLTGMVHISGLPTVTAAHIHSGALGQNGDAIITLMGDETMQQVPDGQMLDSTTIKQLLQGNMYINIHTPDYPAGELRGQLNPLIDE